MKYEIEMLEEFLQRVDNTFPVPLSTKQNLYEFALKLQQKATICAEVEGNRIISAVAGYTDNLVNDMAYISIVATLPESQGRGLASKLVKQFIGVCESKKISAVHLYAVPENRAAVSMYEKLGFVNLDIPGEPRPKDMHLVYYIKV